MMNKFTKIITIVVLSVFPTSALFAQFAASLETINPDARSTAMAGVGSATSPDVFSQHWNLAKYAFAKDTIGIGLSYTMWMTTADYSHNLFYLAGYYKLGKHTLSASARYSLGGNSEYRTAQGTLYDEQSQNEFAIDLGYSRAFNSYFSMGFATRFLSLPKTEDAGNNIYVPERTSAIAFDLGLYFHYPVREKDEFALGLTFKNLGTKVALNDNTKSFLPMTMYLGSRYSWAVIDKHTLTGAIEISKPLVPRRQENKSVIEGLFSSFGNNVKEWGFSFGAEYSYDQNLFARLGYHIGDVNYRNGVGSYISIGGGMFVWRTLSLDVSYMISTSGVASMSNNIRASLQYTF